MENTGERYMPLLRKPDHPGNLFHDERYELAALFCHGKSVLEIGCGAGYGAAILAKDAKRVTAFDNSEEAIEYSHEHYPLLNLTFQVNDICNLHCYYSNWQVIVAYEVLEHIIDGTVLMQLIKESLTPGGVALISTPSPVAHGSGFHLHEYDLEEFENLLSAYFKKYVILNHRPGTFSFNMEGVHTYIGIVWNE